MKVAVVHNINQDGVINHIGRPNKEMYFRDEIDLFLSTLREAGHVVEEFEGDKCLLQKLEVFLPPISKKTSPESLVFNLAYGIQGESRYSHLPAMLEMAGIPYTGSGPLTHSLALDKEMTKRILLQGGVPTPRFIVVKKNENVWEKGVAHGLNYPVIIKPKDEAASFGISVVDNDEEMLRNVEQALQEFKQDLLVEEFLSGRELNVAILGNGASAETFVPVEIDFHETGERFQSNTGKKGGDYKHLCPAEIPSELSDELQLLSRKTFALLKCNDYARVDFRLDEQMKPYVLEVNSMAAIHKKGSFFHGAKNAGYDYRGMLDKMVKVAISRF